MRNYKDARLLVIAPHADDEVLGCGGLISKIKNDGGEVYVLIFNVGSIVKKNNKKVAIVFEGRDAAGKGSTIKRFTEYCYK